VYGMTSRARCLTALGVPANSSLPPNVLGRFVLGSQGAASGDDNELRLVEVREQPVPPTLTTPASSSLLVRELALFPYASGEVWALAGCPQIPEMLFASSRDVNGTAHSSIFRIPSSVLQPSAPSSGSASPQTGGAAVAGLERVCNIETPATVRSAAWDSQAEETQPRFAVGDASGNVRVVSVREDGTAECDSIAGGDTPIVPATDGGVQEVRWCCVGQPLVAVAGGAGVAAFDARCKPKEGPAWSLSRAVACGRVHSVDLNPLAMHRVATTGEDGIVRLWDVRVSSTSKPHELLALKVHSHWGNTVRYSPHHDELLLTGGTDGSVALTYAPSAAAAADPEVRALAEGASGSTAAAAAMNAQSAHVGEDIVVHTYHEHEDSVYAVEWCPVAIGALWAFASLSYAGRLLVSAVPRKYCDLSRYC